MAMRNAGINPVTDWPGPTTGRASWPASLARRRRPPTAPATPSPRGNGAAITRRRRRPPRLRAPVRPARCNICRVMDPAANVSTGPGVNAVSDSVLTDEAVARFQRLGFLVVTGLTPLGDLETVSRLLAGPYPRLHQPPGAPRAHHLRSRQHKTPP